MSVLAGDVYQTQVIGSVFGQSVRHVRTWFIDSVTGVIADDQAFMQAFLDDTKMGGTHDIVTRYINCLSQSYKALQYTVQKVDPVRFYRRTTDFPALTVGARLSALTGNLQAAINVNGIFGSRRYRASYKIGPLANVDTDAGLIVAGLKTALLTYADTFLLSLSESAGGGSAVLIPAVYHAGTRVPFTPGTADQIVGYHVRDEARVKGTRTIGRGE